MTVKSGFGGQTCMTVGMSAKLVLNRKTSQFAGKSNSTDKATALTAQQTTESGDTVDNSGVFLSAVCNYEEYAHVPVQIQRISQPIEVLFVQWSHA